MHCSVEGCQNNARCKGMCAMHWARFKRRGHTDDMKPRKVCLIEDCNNTTFSKEGICTTHYKQRWYLNSVGRGELIVRTSEERWINKYTGYVMVKQDGALTYEHRVLAEKALGKPLPPKAIIHHMCTRDDNHGFFKLVICPSQEYHLLLHKRMEELGYEDHKDA